MTPEQTRPTLMEVIHQLDRASRLYRASIIHAPGEIDRLGWPVLCDLADRTAEQARLVLNRTTMPDRSSYDFDPPPAFLTHELTERIRGRRANVSAPAPRRPGLH